MNTLDLHKQIEKVCPIIGISIGVTADKTTWRVDYDPSATDAQQSAAKTVVTAYNPDAVSLLDQKTSALEFLKQSDIKLLRHTEEVTLGVTPFLSDADYKTLLQQRQTQRAILSQ